MNAASFDPWDNLNGPSPPGLHWTTDNVGEAAPGVLSPLGWSVWGDAGETATRTSFEMIGALSRAEARIPDDVMERIVRCFRGRLAMQVELMTMLGDRLPGTSGQEMARAIFGKVPEDIAYNPTARRYPVVAWKLPATFLGIPRRLRRDTPEIDAWWRKSVAELPGAGLDRAKAMLAESLQQFDRALLLQTVAVVGSAQLMYDALTQLVEKAGTGDTGVLSGAGGAELAVIRDIWAASRGRITIEDVIANHGFHGPLEGEVSSTVWREDPAPLRKLIAEYAERDEAADPARIEQEAAAKLPAEQEKVLAALPRAQRPGARMVLKLAAKRMPLRGIAKRSFLQALDVIRGSARRIGAHLAEQGDISRISSASRPGMLDDPEDVFYLTTEELLGELPADARSLVAKRRERRASYREVVLPGSWKGDPEPIDVSEHIGDGSLIEGIGVSAGVVEGAARVVTDPSFAEVEPDEILIAPTTDPSWSSIMFISSALVVDIGGAISHAAVVARELGIPCVVNTRVGTRRIKTGDRVRVDGGTGTVEILG